MSAEFWKNLFLILMTIEVARVGISVALYMKRNDFGADEPDPEWENEVEYAGYDE